MLHMYDGQGVDNDAFGGSQPTYLKLPGKNEGAIVCAQFHNSDRSRLIEITKYLRGDTI